MCKYLYPREPNDGPIFNVAPKGHFPSPHIFIKRLLIDIWDISCCISSYRRPRPQILRRRVLRVLVYRHINVSGWWRPFVTGVNSRVSSQTYFRCSEVEHPIKSFGVYSRKLNPKSELFLWICWQVGEFVIPDKRISQHLKNCNEVLYPFQSILLGSFQAFIASNQIDWYGELSRQCSRQPCHDSRRPLILVRAVLWTLSA